MNNVFDFFDTIYCINLPQHADRRRAASLEFERVGILNRIEWISAPPPPPGFSIDLYRRNPAAEFGCSLSHATAVVRALDNRSTNVLVLEDDVKFNDKLTEVLPVALSQLPTDWVGCYLGYNHIRTKPFSSHLATVQTIDCTHAYALNGTALYDFFAFWTYGITHGLVNSGKHSPVDTILSQFLADSGRGYVVIPSVAIQDETIQSVIHG